MYSVSYFWFSLWTVKIMSKADWNSINSHVLTSWTGIVCGKLVMPAIPRRFCFWLAASERLSTAVVNCPRRNRPKLLRNDRVFHVRDDPKAPTVLLRAAWQLMRKVDKMNNFTTGCFTANAFVKMQSRSNGYANAGFTTDTNVSRQESS